MKVVWDDYQPSDKEAVEKLHNEMCLKCGVIFDLPDLDKEPILIAQVGRVNGVVKFCTYLEAEVEVCVAGSSPLSAKQLAPAAKRMTDVAASYNLRIARAFVPESMLKPTKKMRWSAIERTLLRLGFRRENGAMVQFYKWLSK